MTLIMLALAVIILPITKPVVLRLHNSSREYSVKVSQELLADSTIWNLLSACFAAGLPTSTAIDAVLPAAPATLAQPMTKVKNLLALGADPTDAWQPAMNNPATAVFAKAARRSSQSGTALAAVASQLAKQSREELVNSAESRAQRAGVLLAAPLTLCFLPSFLCLGVVPIVIGLMSGISQHW